MAFRLNYAAVKVYTLALRETQEMFKKAAYLSSGSIDSRPTYQRDAVDDDYTGGGSGSSDGVNVISWRDMAMGKGPQQGAAYGSMIMPQLKGGKRAPKGNRLLPNVLASVRLRKQSSTESLNLAPIRMCIPWKSHQETSELCIVQGNYPTVCSRSTDLHPIRHVLQQSDQVFIPFIGFDCCCHDGFAWQEAQHDATVPFSLEMAGWADIDATTTSAGATVDFDEKEAAPILSNSALLSSAEQPVGFQSLNSIAGWQAIAAEVSVAILSMPTCRACWEKCSIPCCWAQVIAEGSGEGDGSVLEELAEDEPEPSAEDESASTDGQRRAVALAKMTQISSAAAKPDIKSRAQ